MTSSTVVSSTHEDDQIVVSTPKNKTDLIEASSSNKSPLSKNEEKLKSPMQPNDDNVENKEDQEENLMNEEQLKSSMQPNDDNVENKGDKEEYVMVIVCDTCGDQGREKLLAICATCKTGAEHTYCMEVELKRVPREWHCHDCTEEKNRMRKDEETRSGKRKAESSIDPFEMSKKTSSQRQPDLLTTQSNNGTEGMDMNQDVIPDLNVEPTPDLNLDPNPGLNLDPEEEDDEQYRARSTKLFF